MSIQAQPTTTAFAVLPRDDQRERSGPGLEKAGPEHVLRCRNPQAGDVMWFFTVEDGDVYRFHEWRGFRRELVFREVAEAIVDDPDVRTAVLPRRFLEWYRERGEQDV